MSTATERVQSAIRSFPFWDFGMDDVDPKSKYAEWVPALAANILAALDDDPHHVIEVTETGWILKHPLDCRELLFECEFNRAAMRLAEMPANPGRYRCSVDDGALVVGKAVGGKR